MKVDSDDDNVTNDVKLFHAQAAVTGKVRSQIIMHHYDDMAPQRYWGQDLDLLGSREIISHMTIRLAVVDFLWVVHSDHASILHLCGDIAM